MHNTTNDHQTSKLQRLNRHFLKKLCSCIDLDKTSHHSWVYTKLQLTYKYLLYPNRNRFVFSKRYLDLKIPRFLAIQNDYSASVKKGQNFGNLDRSLHLKEIQSTLLFTNVYNLFYDIFTFTIFLMKCHARVVLMTTSSNVSYMKSMHPAPAWLHVCSG